MIYLSLVPVYLRYAYRLFCSNINIIFRDIGIPISEVNDLYFAGKKTFLVVHCPIYNIYVLYIYRCTFYIVSPPQIDPSFVIIIRHHARHLLERGTKAILFPEMIIRNNAVVWSLERWKKYCIRISWSPCEKFNNTHKAQSNGEAQ